MHAAHTTGGTVCDLCGCGVWAGTKRAHSRAARHIDIRARVASRLQTVFGSIGHNPGRFSLPRSARERGSISLCKDCRLRERRVGSEPAILEPPRKSKTSNKEGVSSFVSNRWTYEREPKNPHAIRFGAQREADLRHSGWLAVYTLSLYHVTSSLTPFPSCLEIRCGFM